MAKISPCTARANQKCVSQYEAFGGEIRRACLTRKVRKKKKFAIWPLKCRKFSRSGNIFFICVPLHNQNVV